MASLHNRCMGIEPIFAPHHKCWGLMLLLFTVLLPYWAHAVPAEAACPAVVADSTASYFEPQQGESPRWQK